jgi:hypothetical protein
MTLRTYQIHTLILLLALLVLVFPWVASAESFIASTVWTIVGGFFGFFVGLAGNLLDFAITGYVIGFGDSYLKSGVGVAVDTLWIAIRDIFNLTFIFALVFIGLKMILDSDDSGTRRWLVHLILAALLVNFSLYITKFIVDFTNIMATEVAQAFPLDNNGKMSISYGFMNSLGVTTLLKSVPGDSPWAFIFGSAILFLVMIFTFGAGAILLLIRYAVLSLYMVFSPLMFLGWVFPQMQSYTSKYWSGFLGRAFFAPIYLLLVYFSYYVVATIYAWNGANSMSPDFKGVFGTDVNTPGSISSSVESTLMTFLIACIFLIASIVIASKLGMEGGNMAVTMGRRYGQSVGRFATRHTVGYGAQGLNAVSERAQRGYRRLDAYANQSRTGRFLRGAATVASLGALSDRNVEGALGAGQRVSVAGSETAAQARQRRAARQNRQNATANDMDRERRLEEATAEVENHPVTPASTDAEIEAHQTARQEQAQAVSQLTPEQLLELLRQDRARVMSPEFASLLSDAQITALQNSGMLRNDEVDTLLQNRDAGSMQEINQVLTNGNASVDNLNTAIDNLNRTVSTMSDERISRLDAGTRNNPAFAASMSQAQFDTYMNSNASQADKNTLRAARNAGQQRIAQHGSVVDPATASAAAANAGFQDRHRRRMFRNAQQAGALPAAVLADPGVAQYITPRIIEEFLANNPTPADIDSVRINVNNYIAGATPEIRNAWYVWRTTTAAGARFT